MCNNQQFLTASLTIIFRTFFGVKVAFIAIQNVETSAVYGIDAMFSSYFDVLKLLDLFWTTNVLSRVARGGISPLKS
jgi:hypothetical protein